MKVERVWLIGAVSMFAVSWVGAAFAISGTLKCQADKNKAAGKYAKCRQDAEKKLVLTGDATRYTDLIANCETKFADAWQRAEDNATAASTSCLDAPLTSTDFKTVIDEHCTNIAAALGGGGLVDCAGDFTACTTNLEICSAGTAVSGDVLSGETFSSSAGLGLVGSMANKGAVSLLPGQIIAAGYHNGAGLCASDSNLVTGNIKAGVSIFGVTGDPSVADTSSGDAAGGDVLAGKKCWVDGGEVTGSAALGGNVVGTDGEISVIIPNGLYVGSKTATVTDSDLLAINIRGGVNIFGVSGSFFPTSGLLKTGQVQCDQGNETLGPCATESPAKQDGALQKGLARSFTDNGETVTDNVTLLEWEKLCDQDPPAGLCPQEHDVDTAYTWTGAFAKVAALNSAAFGGHADWRMPNLIELHSIVDYGAVGPSTYAPFNSGCVAPCAMLACSCTQSFHYWSSTTYQNYATFGWLVDFAVGNILGSTKPEYYYVRAVRGGL